MSFPIRPILILSSALAFSLGAPAVNHGLRAQSAPTADATPQFTILIFERPADLERRNDPTRADEYWTAYDEFAAFLMQSGALRGGSAVSETETAIVRGSGGANRAVNGARLGGYFVVAAKDLTAARALAAKAPAFAVTVEVRPHRENPHMAKMMAKPSIEE